METVRESDGEEQFRGGETREEEDDDGAPHECLGEKSVFVPTNYNQF